MSWSREFPGSQLATFQPLKSQSGPTKLLIVDAVIRDYSFCPLLGILKSLLRTGSTGVGRVCLEANELLQPQFRVTWSAPGSRRCRADRQLAHILDSVAQNIRS